MEILLDVTQSPDGRLTGTARLPASRHALVFSGVMELVALVEELCGFSPPPGGPASPPAGGGPSDAR
jgi:hypothetical protein